MSVCSRARKAKPVIMSRLEVAIDQVCGVRPCGFVVPDSAKAFGKLAGPRIVLINVTHKARKFAIVPCPVQKPLRSLKSNTLAFLLRIDEPTQFVFWKKWAVIDTDLTEA